MIFTRAPCADLAGRIETCWSFAAEGGRGIAFREYFPDASVNLIFRFSSSGCRMVLLGPATAKATVELDLGAQYLGIRFRPGQVPRLADVGPAELTDGRVELDRLGGMRIGDLAEQLSTLPDPSSRLHAVESLVRGAPALARDARCREAARLLEASGGRLRVDHLARALGLHVRSLERLLLEGTGLPPKRLARLLRVHHLLRRLHAADFGSLAELAAACGYADQSHMTRDLKALTGRLPGERESLPPRRLAGVPRTPVVHRYRP